MFPKDTWSKYKSRAKIDGREFSIKREDFVIPEFCPAIGLRLDWSDLNHTPVMDRIDNDKGYISGNIAIVSAKANTIKRNLSVAQLKQMGDFYASRII